MSLCASSSHCGAGLRQPHGGAGRGWGTVGWSRGRWSRGPSISEHAQKQGRPNSGSQRGPSPGRNQPPAKMLSGPVFIAFFFFFLSRDASHTLVHVILPSSRTLRDLIMDSRLLDPELPLSGGGGICHPLSRRSPPLFMLHSTARVTSNPTTPGRMSKFAQW